LTIESIRGDFSLPVVQAYREPEDLPPCDVALVCLKSTQNHLLARLVPPAVKRGGFALVLQNGLGVEDDAAKHVGADRILGGLCFLCSNKVGPGHIRHLDYGMVTLGEYRPDGSPGGVTDRLRETGEDFEKAGIPIRISDDLAAARWHKLVWNVPFNGLSVALDAATDKIMAHPASLALTEALMAEVVAGAAALGKTISPSFVSQMLRDTQTMAPYLTSMKLDYDRRQPMELEAIFGNPLRAAAAAGCECPRLEALYRMLCFLDARNTAPEPTPAI
jgi:2-dehydropantoate 2-reductase